MDLLALKENLETNALGRIVLKVASKIYGAGAWMHRSLYENGWKSAQSVNSRVVCIGNLTAGGDRQNHHRFIGGYHASQARHARGYCVARVQTAKKSAWPRHFV